MSKELEQLEDPDTWDLENAVRIPGRKEGRRTIVSVAFPTEDAHIVACAAESEGKKMSEFIRDTAVAAALQLTRNVVLGFTATDESTFVRTDASPSVAAGPPQVIRFDAQPVTSI